MTEKQREELKLKAKAAMDKENVRNNGDNAIGLHVYNEVCSCGQCHTADTVVEALVEYCDKHWIKFETSQETLDLIKAMDEGEEESKGNDAVFGGEQLELFDKKLENHIEISKLTPEDVGKWVIYKTPYKTETGKIKSWNDKNIFVVYKCAGDWDNYKEYTAAATNPKDLILSDTKPITMKDYDGIGDFMTIESFIACCECGGFIDYDGFGYYATETQQSDKVVRPSFVTGRTKAFNPDTEKFYMKEVKENIDESFTHVVWYNR